MSGGNGVDLGHVVAMLADVLAAQEATRVEVAAIRSEHGHKLATLDRKVDDLAATVATMRGEITEYHNTVVGHGVLISELDERTTRVERHLDLPPPRAAE